MAHARTTIATAALLVALVPTRNDVPMTRSLSLEAGSRRQATTVSAEWPLAAYLPGCDATADRAVHRPGEADCPQRTELPGATVYTDSLVQLANVKQALRRFAEAGIELPHVDVWLVDGDHCIQNEGRPATAGFTVNTAAGSGVFSCSTLFALLHELGHVWDHHSLSAADQVLFLRVRGLTMWETERTRSGGEQLADVMAWALSPDHPRPSRSLPNDDASLTEAFQAATGRNPLP